MSELERVLKKNKELEKEILLLRVLKKRKKRVFLHINLAK